MTYHVSPTMTKRLEECVSRSGGKRALAAMSGISEAQLYRYLTGESILPTDRLESIAKAAQVDTAWLLTGRDTPEGPLAKDPRPSFRPELMIQIAQAFDELLVEYDKTFTPKQKARAVSYMYEALRHMETYHGIEITPQKSDMLEMVSFISDLRTEEEINVLHRLLHVIEYTDFFDTDSNMQFLTTFCSLISRGYKSYYDSHIGTVYFERMGLKLDPQAIERLIEPIEATIKRLKKTDIDLLDMGCGNGRHISYLHRHMPNVRVRGIEISEQAVELCRTLSNAGKLPQNSVIQGDFRSTPYQDQSFNLILSRMSLWSTPYFPDTGLGMEEVFNEIFRLLRPGGTFVLTSIYGHRMEHFTFKQFLNEEDVKQLCASANLKLVAFDRMNSTSDNGGQGGIDYQSVFDNAFRAIIVK